jgi:hypothetical protein
MSRAICPIGPIGPIWQRSRTPTPRRYVRTAPIFFQDLPISVLRDILGNRGSFNRTVDQNP